MRRFATAGPQEEKDMRRTLSLVMAMAFISTLVWVLPEARAQGGSSGDEAALRKAQEDFAAAWNNHDAQAMAALWAEDGDWVGPDGNYVQGRQRIEDMLAEAHTGDWASSHLTVKVLGVRFLKPDVGVVNAEQEITGARDFFDNALPNQKVVATSIMVKKDGKWQTAVYRAFVPPPPPPED
jgi:uncharacterized protein (TIGR02246 family)